MKMLSTKSANKDNEQESLIVEENSGNDEFHDIPIEEEVGQDYDSKKTKRYINGPRRKRCLRFAASVSLVIGITLAIPFVKHQIQLHRDDGSSTASIPLPSILMEKGLYTSSELSNERLPYWNDKWYTSSMNIQDNNTTTFSPIQHWGPCFIPHRRNKIKWEKAINRNMNRGSPVSYPYKTAQANTNKKGEVVESDLSGFCRPGFIILGAGKCGTSSLYHYLIDHPQVLPARKKQIHYFKYFADRSMRWYLSYFPSTEDFLSSGALMTGEASPGYLPYPPVAHLMKQRMMNIASTTPDDMQQQYQIQNEHQVLPKLITIVRDPIERAYSSYNYNYIDPAIKILQRGYKGAKKKKHKKYYMENGYLFSFEEMIEAELKVLKECLVSGGAGEEYAATKYGTKEWASGEFERREREGLPPMVALDDACYGSETPRKQWVDLVEKYPNKIINIPNIHLVQSFIGRSLYTFPLEWWYGVFPKDVMYIFCNENLRDNTAESMSDLSDFLGLPQFDFSAVASEGMYNVGKNPGYDKPSSWQNVTDTSEIPLSEGLRKQLLSFIEPYNERLFELVGKRCHGWTKE